MTDWTPDRPVDTALAGRLIAKQFPRIDISELSQAGAGWDNVVYRADGRFFRFPVRRVAVEGVRKEIACLPVLARHVNGLPEPVHIGEPDPDYPWPFFGYVPLPGREACDAGLDDDTRQRLARPLARFLRRLHAPGIAAALRSTATAHRVGWTRSKGRMGPFTAMPAVNPVKLRGAVRKFRRYFRKGFTDPRYALWERDYKWAAHERWEAELGAQRFAELLRSRWLGDIAAAAIKIESRTNLLFSFEKMALRDGVRTEAGARTFAEGLHEVLHGDHDFGAWCEALAALPRRQTRVLTWPAATVFLFLAQPDKHFFLKPRVTTLAAERCGVPLEYDSKPSSAAYARLLDFAHTIRDELEDYDLSPRDMIDVQSFLWVQGSDEYP